MLSNAMIELLYPGIRTHFVASRGQLSEPHHVLLGFQVPTSASGYLAAVKPSLCRSEASYHPETGFV